VTGMLIALAVCTLIMTPCWILVLTKIFAVGDVGLAVLGIFIPPVVFVYGWMHADELGVIYPMIGWTIGFVGSLAVLSLPWLHSMT
jgi:hypothetical protein